MEQQEGLEGLCGFYFKKYCTRNILSCVCVWFPQMILDAQCQATRDAQIQEKMQIQVELLEEEKRLDAIMEVERHKAMEAEKEIDELRKQQRIR